MAAEGSEGAGPVVRHQPHVFHRRRMGRERAVLRRRRAPRRRSGLGHARLRARAGPRADPDRPRRAAVGGGPEPVRAGGGDPARTAGAAAGEIGIEETMPFTFAKEIGAAAPAARLRTGTPVTAGCRMIKDAHELALMRRANEITVRAHRAVFASLREGMTQSEASALSSEAHRRLGMRGGSLVLFGPDAAFPHGTTQPRPLRRGDVVLIDGGGPAARLRQRHHAHRRLRRRRRPSASARSGTSCGGPSRPPSRPRGRGWRRRRWTPRRAA